MKTCHNANYLRRQSHSTVSERWSCIIFRTQKPNFLLCQKCLYNFWTVILKKNQFFLLNNYMNGVFSINKQSMFANAYSCFSSYFFLVAEAVWIWISNVSGWWGYPSSLQQRRNRTNCIHARWCICFHSSGHCKQKSVSGERYVWSQTIVQGADWWWIFGCLFWGKR